MKKKRSINSSRVGKKSKSLLILAVLTFMLIAFGMSVFAYTLDDAIAGKVGVGGEITFGSYGGSPLTWYYLGDGYFVCNKVTENRAYDTDSNLWEPSDLNNYLNTTFYQSSLGSDSRITCVTIPSYYEYDKVIKDFEDFKKNKESISIIGGYFLRSPYYNRNNYVWYVDGSGNVISSGSGYGYVNSALGIRPAFRLKSSVKNGGSVAWNDITGKPALAAASHDHSSISGNAATATYATSAGNADTVDGSHAAVFASNSHNHSGQTLAVNISGNATTATNATNADTVDSKHASDFTVAGGTVAWSNVTGKPTTVEGYGITDGQRQMFTVIKGFKFDAYAVGSYTSPTGLATTSILSGAATKITGTLSTAGPTVVDCSSNKKLYFNVIEAPADDTTATVTFM